MVKGDKPTYDLARIKLLVATRQYRITGTAQCDIGVLGFDEDDVCSCIAALSAVDFHKTMPSEQAAGLFQDAYKPKFLGKWLYVKLQIAKLDAPGEFAVVISFKQR
jgi:hypothetical protein